MKSCEKKTAIRILTPGLLAVAATLVAMGAGRVARAEVSLKNGDFFKSYTDIAYSGGFDPKIERIYNSKTNFASGMFGPGWGVEYEEYLTVSADGSVVVHEWGGGAENRFSPSAYHAEDVKQAIQSIAAAKKQAGDYGSDAQMRSDMTKMADATYRNNEWDKLVHAGKVKPRHLPVGTQLHSNKFSYQYITRVADGYVRVSDTGKTEKFNDLGRLVKVSDRNGNYVDLSYGRDGHIQKLVDNFNRRMLFTFNDKGHVDTIEGVNGQKTQYRYNGAGMLVWSKDAEGNVYTYKYDNYIPVPNMTEIGYADNTTMKVTYYGPEKLQNVRSVKERDGTLTEYTYWTDSSDKGHTRVGVLTKEKSGRKISQSRYEYFMKHKASGEEWQYKMITDLDGDRTETTYNECCGMPLLIKHNREETAFEYDIKGHVTKKITPTDITILAYDPKVSKVSKVTRMSKTNRRSTSWSVFTYDAKGNLVFAKNSENRGVKLFYDDHGRIRSMVDQARRQINFKYNENSKPVEITDPALGTINVSYTESGEIKKVESTAGRKIALQVTSAFQNLLDIIRPAGVTLSF